MTHVPLAGSVRRRKAILRVVTALMLLMGVGAAGCSSVDVKASYRPAFLPVKLEWGPDGMVKLTGDSSIVTPIGVFSLGTEHALSAKKPNVIYVIFRNANGVLPGSTVVGTDQVFEVMSGGGQFTAVVNGTAVIQVADQEVLIDVTDGSVRVIEFKAAQAVMQEQPSGIALRWQQFWDDCFYSPMALSRWAYDDSTMDKWFGLGFFWFLIRLVLALILGVVDLLLTAGCFLAAIGFLVAGTTGRNIVYGVEVLLFIILVFLSRDLP
ncbi:hypothetical protein ACIBQX_11995 [Nonomuraea sp. NPDC049714]|uniref:hypothetical protein n=1 Tax=Nonomuraea sp. NPDC049714 TaxID=3364357 RepID=UPI003796FB02